MIANAIANLIIAVVFSLLGFAATIALIYFAIGLVIYAITVLGAHWYLLLLAVIAFIVWNIFKFYHRTFTGEDPPKRNVSR